MLRKDLFRSYLETGLMIFSMSFGAGNVIFPLLAGYLEQKNIFLNLLGFWMTSVFLPMLGFISTMKFKGKYLDFLAKYSNSFFAYFLTFVSMSLLGPFGCIPRCVDFAHTTFLRSFSLPSVLGSFFIFIFLFLAAFLAMKKENLSKILGRVLAPITITSLVFFIVLGIANSDLTGLSVTKVFSYQSFWVGFFDGQFTFDLLAMIFYSQVIYQTVYHFFVSREESEQEPFLETNIFNFLVISSILSGIFFTFIYGGMILTANLHAADIQKNLLGNQLFSFYSAKIFGSRFGFLQDLFIVSSCFSTTIALLVVFSDYLETLFFGKFSYKQCLFFSTLASLFFTFLGFVKIMQTMSFLIRISYPFLILIVLFSSFNLLCSGCFKKIV